MRFSRSTESVGLKVKANTHGELLESSSSFDRHAIRSPPSLHSLSFSPDKISLAWFAAWHRHPFISLSFSNGTFSYALLLCLGTNTKLDGGGPRIISVILTQSAAELDPSRVSRSFLPKNLMDGMQSRYSRIQGFFCLSLPTETEIHIDST